MWAFYRGRKALGSAVLAIYLLLWLWELNDITTAEVLPVVRWGFTGLVSIVFGAFGKSWVGHGSKFAAA